MFTYYSILAIALAEWNKKRKTRTTILKKNNVEIQVSAYI